ncbi:ATP diphosphatase [Sphingomonas jejuensis]|uniref:ATP diphosphatase n=1 Tax=Sphingomonas jejuensis TaxID=904715 RepID=A0ABX0XJH6_9SPHN|nr:nucleoside triphosphate pyrophosphohydrolase [Sphingomonas jejuensis]NJC33493.1 ATP diphosphatase [Sphingomonas jejuensis]
MAEGSAFERLRAIMARLRDAEHGCEWDRAQTFRSIAPYTIEEAYEVADAIERDDAAALRDELGDLQLQVVFHARIAEDLGLFDVDDVLRGIADKMERRHPHIFGDADTPGWESIKAEERAALADKSALAGVAIALPALSRAEKIGKRASRVGFDWPDAEGARLKVDEELAELANAATAAEREEEFGDLLFAITNLARHLKIDPEAALRQATTKFERRFRAVEAAAPRPLSALDADALDALWRAVKAKEQQPSSD